MTGVRHKVLFRYFTDIFVFFRMFQVVVRLVKRNEKTLRELRCLLQVSKTVDL